MPIGRSMFWSGSLLSLLVTVTGCGGQDAAGSGGTGGTGGVSIGGVGGDGRWDEAASVQVALSAMDQAELGRLEAQLADLADLTTTELLQRRAPTFSSDLGYDPMSAVGLSLIQASPLALDQAALDKLAANGFVIEPARQFPNMAYGYVTIYAQDLPVYVSLDSILDTVHLSYDAILKAIERDVLISDLGTLLSGARGGLTSVTDATVATDLDLYLSVALSLLEGTTQAPVAGGDADALATIVAAATVGEGIASVALFGTQRDMDFSQFKPRGHYAGDIELERYFRAMMWLGRTDFRLIETLSNGEQILRTRQLAAVLTIRDLIDGTTRAAYDRIDAVVTAFVGEHDYMQLADVDALMTDLGVATAADLSTVDPDTLAQTIIDHGYGAQRIASQVIFKAPTAGADSLPLDRSFALLGQRYVVDSHVFSNVVFDRVPPATNGPRTLPDPLDAAYAALGNPAALPLLETQLNAHNYAEHLERMRVLTDAHDDSFWNANLYNRWLTSLRTVSAKAAPDPMLPSVAQSEAWSRRILNTQLGSWAQLRHDTILYAKQSYTTGSVCEFPDAYVDPYPQAFAALVQYADHGLSLSALLSGIASSDLVARVRQYFMELRSVAAILEEMAMQERTGTPFNDMQMAFINSAVTTEFGVCGEPPTFTGWYARLLFDVSDEEMDPTIADVHTDPGGDRPPAVLHVATGLPRLMVVTTNSCTGPRAYAGLAFAYHEVVTGLDRLTDDTWAEMAPNASDVPWMQAVLP